MPSPSWEFRAHLGSDLSADWREHIAAIEMAGRHANVYLDTGGTVLTRYLEQAVKELGPRKMIFGSDEPEVDCRPEIFKVRVLRLAREIHRDNLCPCCRQTGQSC